MCGIVGCAGNILNNEKKMFRDMLLFDVVRGQDSTGILSVPAYQAGKPDVYKDIGSPLALWDVFAANNAFDNRGILKAQTKLMLGHNRAATMGKVTVENAHPFEYGDVIGVHNGSLVSHKNLEGNHEVDSRAIYDTIDKKGIEYTWSKLWGAAALVWWDKKTGLLHMIRNDQRPLFLARNKKGDVLFWASEAWMIRIAAMRNGVELATDDKGMTISPASLPVNHLFTFEPTATGVKDKVSGGKELANFCPPKVTTTYSQTPGFTGAAKSGNQWERPKNKTAKINLDWAQGRKKAGKEFRDRECIFRFASRMWVNSSLGKAGYFTYYMVASLVDGDKQRVEIYPETLADYEKWESIKNNAGLRSEVIIKMTARPRVKYDERTKTETYMIGSRHIRLVSIKKPAEGGKVVEDEIPFGGNETPPEETFRGPQGAMMSREGLARAIKRAGSSCLSCDLSLTTDDHEEIEWVREDAILCKSCAGDPYVEQIVRNM